MVGMAELIGGLWLLGFTIVAIIGYFKGDLGIAGVGIAALFLTMVFAPDFLRSVMDGIFDVAASPIQGLLAEFGIFTSRIVSGVIGVFIALIAFFGFLSSVGS